jgi:tRNA(Arg) A34 adenosine deaminase TadA
MAPTEVPVGGNPRTPDEVLYRGWEQALRLAWDAFRAQTTPVGAVIVNRTGAIVAAGRGRRYETTAPDGQLAGTHVAHAEINALAQLSAQRHWEDALLLTSLEPCVMCHGAAIQSAVAGFYFAGRDPYAGSANLQFQMPQARRRAFVVKGPLAGPRGAFAEMLHIAFLLRRNASSHVVAVQRSALPRMTSYTEDVQSQLQDAVRRDDYRSAVDLAASAPRD